MACSVAMPRWQHTSSVKSDLSIAASHLPQESRSNESFACARCLCFFVACERSQSCIIMGTCPLILLASSEWPSYDAFMTILSVWGPRAGIILNEIIWFLARIEQHLQISRSSLSKHDLNIRSNPIIKLHLSYRNQMFFSKDWSASRNLSF